MGMSRRPSLPDRSSPCSAESGSALDASVYEATSATTARLEANTRTRRGPLVVSVRRVPPLPMATVPVRLPDKNKHLAEVYVALNIDRRGGECRTLTPGSDPNVYCGDVHRCLACRARETNALYTSVYQEQYAIDESVQDLTDGVWMYPPPGQQRRKENIRFFTNKTISLFWGEPDARKELIKVGGASLTADDLKLMKHLGGLKEIKVLISDIGDRGWGVRKARGYHIPEQAFEEYWRKTRPESAWDREGIVANLCVVLGLCWVWEDPDIAPDIKDHLSEVADWSEVRADLEFDMESVWYQVRQETREDAMADLMDRHRRVVNEAQQRAEREANMQRVIEAKTEITYEVDRLANALHHAEQLLLAKSAVIASLQDAVNTKNETIATLEEALEPYEDKDKALREDVLRVELARANAERMYLAAEKEAGMSPHTRAKGAQDLFDALREVQVALRDMGRRVGVSIDPTSGSAVSAGATHDAVMSGAASTEPPRGQGPPQA